MSLGEWIITSRGVCHAAKPLIAIKMDSVLFITVLEIITLRVFLCWLLWSLQPVMDGVAFSLMSVSECVFFSFLLQCSWVPPTWIVWLWFMALAPDPCPANDGCKLVGSQRSSPSPRLLCGVMFLLVSLPAVLMTKTLLGAVQDDGYVQD